MPENHKKVLISQLDKKMKKLTFIALAALLVASCGNKSNSGKPAMKTLKDSFSYAFGTFVGTHMLKANEIKDINWEVFKTAVEKSIVNGDSGLALDKESIDRVINTYLAEAKYGKNKKIGEDYLAAKKKEGYNQTASGLLYKVVKNGNGVKPGLTDTAMIYYTGKKPDGSLFDSNEGKSAMKVPMNSNFLVKGFMEALGLMDEGAVYDIIIPSSLGYGEKGMPDYNGKMIIEPYQVMTFNLRMESIKR